jgi:hypothetical protein
MKIPHDFQDYDDDDPEIEVRRNRDKFWRALRACRNDYDKDNENSPRRVSDFVNFLEDIYGLKLVVDNDMITDKYHVVHEGLYSFFVLKYM